MDHDGPVGLPQHLLERGADVGRLLPTRMPSAPSVTQRSCAKFCSGVGPELLAALGLLAAVHAVEAALRAGCRSSCR